MGVITDLKVKSTPAIISVPHRITVDKCSSHTHFMYKLLNAGAHEVGRRYMI